MQTTYNEDGLEQQTTIYKSPKQNVSFKKPRHMNVCSMYSMYASSKSRKNKSVAAEIRTVVTFEEVATEKGIRGRIWCISHVLFLEGVCSFCNNSLSCTFMIWILFVNLTLFVKFT